MAETPKVLVLGPITPTVNSARSGELRYEKLTPAVQKYASGEKARQEVFWNSEPDSLEEQQAAQQLASQYMLMSAAKLNNEAVRPESKKLWSERYTQATSEIYGTPESQFATELINIQSSEVIQAAVEHNVNAELIEHFVDLCERFGISLNKTENREAVFGAAAEKVGAYLKAKYASVFNALDLDSAPATIDAAGIANRFERALAVLSANDEAWSEWAIDRNPDKDQLSIEPGEKKIIVGVNRASVTPSQLKGLFAHEALLHAQRAVNGKKQSKEMGSGLPGYLDAEEGIGVFFEYSITGKIPEKNIDRYVDIALALGQIDNVEHTRQELLDFATTRALLRNELKPEDEKQSDEDVQKSVYAHINRIYRGSLGDENVGVFTKDIAYHKGFLDMGKYILNEIENGKSVEDITDFLVSGKFDPTNQKHLEYIASL